MNLQLKTIFLFTVLLCSNNIIGQNRYGFKGGVNISNQYKKINPPEHPAEKIRTKSLTGFQVGAFWERELNQQFSFGTELNFSTLGSKAEYTRMDYTINPDDGTISGAGTDYYDDKIQQIEVPIFLKYNFKNFYLGVGPTVGVKISSKISNYQGNSYNNGDTYKPFDLSGSSIIGYSIKRKIDITLKYNHGLVDVDKRDYSIIKNRLANFSMRYSL